MTWFTDEQVEKAARAAFDAEIEMWDAGSISIDWDGMEIDDKFPYLVAARAALSAVNPYEGVRLPENVNEAALMVLLGTNYLQNHAPEKLRNSSPQEGK